QAHGIGEVRFGREQIHERALSQSTVADFAASGPAQEFHFADAERREVVVQHETLELILLEEQIEALHVFLSAQRESRERLCFASGEERGAQALATLTLGTKEDMQRLDLLFEQDQF